jgi:hypothetical protein
MPHLIVRLPIYKAWANLLQLGERIFLIGGYSNTTEEFNLTNNTFSVVGAPLIYNHQVNKLVHRSYS